ncbi:MAG: hypothetical protein QNK85_10650 [Crocinitomicaceae bacterium]
MKTLVSLVMILVLFGACIKNNSSPIWIEVTEWDLINNPDENPLDNYKPGVLTHAIKDVWLYVDNSLVGVFEVPFKVPVLAYGSKEIRMIAGIHNNGISATKVKYPFLVPYVITLDLNENETYQIHPVTMYATSTEFWIENFESSSNEFVDGNTTLSSLVSSSDPAILDSTINESQFGRISLNSTDNLYVGSTDVYGLSGIPIDLPKGVDCYLEIDYHNTADITTGILAISATDVLINPLVRINKQFESEVEWKKIYIDLREVVSGSTSADYFEFTLDALLPNGVNSAEINIDNFKTVHF